MIFEKHRQFKSIKSLHIFVIDYVVYFQPCGTATTWRYKQDQLEELKVLYVDTFCCVCVVSQSSRWVR